MSGPGMVGYRLPRHPDSEMLRLGREFWASMSQRRSVRQFAPEPVPREAIELAIAAASTAPSGAHCQPWRFVAVSDPAIKHRIRLGAEAVERRLYQAGRMPAEWREALDRLGTGWEKPFLEIAPWLVVVFAQLYAGSGQTLRKHYFVRESVGIACGLFIVAVHQMGLATVPYTPLPMHFLSAILGRPDHERPYVVFPVGFPAPDAQVPDLRRKPLSEVAIWNPSPS